MGNCWARPSHSPAPNSSTAVGSPQTGCNQSFQEEGRNGFSTSLRLSSLSLGDSRLIGSSNSNTFTTSGASTSYGGSGISLNGLPPEVRESFRNGQIFADPTLRSFTLAELKTATKNFRAENFLGEGGFGSVHKGCLKVKTPVGKLIEQVIAVKRLNLQSMQGFREWQTEINFLGRLSHPNLVRLFGYGREDQELFLVYEYVHRGNLANQLYGRGSNVRPLSWDIRLKVIIGAARGLNFLHSLEQKIIVRDFKPSNILLDRSYTAKLSDFGLAKSGPSADQTHVSTRVMGTHGYTAPEYIATGHLYVKSDVYGFGIVVMEVLTGKRISDIRRVCQRHSLIDWIKSNLLNRMKLRSTMDPRLEGKYPLKLAILVSQLALKCIQTDPKYRPSMVEVVETLENIEAANNNANSKQGANASSSQHVRSAAR